MTVWCQTFRPQTLAVSCFGHWIKQRKKYIWIFQFSRVFLSIYSILVQKQSIFTMTSYWFHKSIEFVFVKTSKDLIGCTVPLWLMAEICTRRSVGGDRDCATPRRVRMNIEYCISLYIFMFIFISAYSCKCSA